MPFLDRHLFWLSKRFFDDTRLFVKSGPLSVYTNVLQKGLKIGLTREWTLKYFNEF